MNKLESIIVGYFDDYDIYESYPGDYSEWIREFTKYLSGRIQEEWVLEGVASDETWEGELIQANKRHWTAKPDEYWEENTATKLRREDTSPW